MTDLFAFAEESAERARRMARATDPMTSHEAALSAVNLAAHHRALILGVLRRERRPMAAQEISDALGWPTHHGVNRRTAELEQDGMIAVVEGDFYTNKSGRKARRYRLRQGLTG